VVISSNNILKELTQNYGESETENGWRTKSSTEYGYANLNDQIKLTPRIRKRYRQEVIDASRGKGALPPLVTDPDDAILNWLNRQIPESGRLNVSLYDVWKGQQDLQDAFPLALGRDAKRFVWWPLRKLQVFGYAHGYRFCINFF